MWLSGAGRTSGWRQDRLQRKALWLAGASVVALTAAIPQGAQAQCAGTTCVVNTGGDGAGSLANPTLRFAIGHANANAGTGITFSISNQTITLTNELPLILGKTTRRSTAARRTSPSAATTSIGRSSSATPPLPSARRSRA